MGLLDTIRAGSLFNADPATQGAIDSYAAMPRGKQGKGGLFGSGYDGEDIMSMLLRAAAIAQGDYGAGAEFGANIGARARAAAQAAAKRQAELADYAAKKQIDVRYAEQKGPEPSPEERLYNWYSGLPASEQDKVVSTLDRVRPRAVGDPLTGYQFMPRPVAPRPVQISPEAWESGTPMGGGSGDATGGFPDIRLNIPRIRP